jgi:hypothetical protein
MPDAQIHPGGTVSVPADYVIPSGAELLLKNAYAKFDGSGAFGDYKPLLRVISDSGSVVAEAVADTIIAAGASADATWFPRVGGAAGIAEITSSDGTIDVVNPTGPVTDITVQATPRVGGHFQGTRAPTSGGGIAGASVTVIDYDPQGMCAALGDTFVTIQQHGLYILAGTASFFNMPGGAVGSIGFRNLSGFPGVFPISVESGEKGTAPTPGGGVDGVVLTTACVCPLDAGDPVEFYIAIDRAPLNTAFGTCVWSLTHIGF